LLAGSDSATQGRVIRIRQSRYVFLQEEEKAGTTAVPGIKIMLSPPAC